MTLLSRYALALLFVLAGSWHFVHPATYLAIMPPWLPQPLALVYASGVFEIPKKAAVLEQERSVQTRQHARDALVVWPLKQASLRGPAWLSGA